MKKLLLISALILTFIPGYGSGYARTFSEILGGQGGAVRNFYEVISEEEKTCRLSQASPYLSGEYTVQQKVNDGSSDFTVIEVGSSAFGRNAHLRSVIVPITVKTIENFAFGHCEKLETVTLPDSLKTIGRGAFSMCPALKEVKIPESVTSLGSELFNGCTSLASVNIPRNITHLDASFFKDCKSIPAIDIPEAVTYIGTDAFSGCTSLTAISIPQAVIAIGPGAFSGCTGLTSTTLPPKEKAIGDRLFSGCTKLSSVKMTDSIISIGAKAFSGCTSMTSLTIPKEVAFIDTGAFSGCTGLTSMAIPEKVSAIADSLFSGCSKLAKVDMPQAITKIGAGAFKDCTGITRMDFPKAITAIGSSAFNGCTGLTSVLIPPTVTNIGTDVFAGCTGLTKSAYPDRFANPFYTGTACPYNADKAVFANGWIFDRDSTAIYFAPVDLKGVYTLPSTIESISSNAFYGCNGLSSIIALPATPPATTDNSFAGLYDTVSLIIDRSSVTDYLGSNWSLFKTIKTSENGSALTTYSDGVLNYRLIPAPDATSKNMAIVIPGDYSELTGVTVPERFTYTEGTANTRYYVDGVGYGAFKNCDRLAAITFSSRNAATVFGDYAFAGTGISQIAIPKTVERIGSNAFRGCPSLSEVDIPGNVLSVGDSAFADLPVLNKITLREGLETIGARAFSNPGTESIDAIYIPSTVTSVGADAFAGCPIDMVEISSLGPWLEIDFANPHANPLSQSGRLSVDGTETDRIIIPKTTAEIKPYAFYGLNALRRLTVSGSVTSIGAGAFAADSGHQVSNIEFAYGPEPISIDTTAFTAPVRLKWDRSLNGFSLRTDSITELRIGNNVTRIPASIFSNIAPLSSLSLGTAIEEIGSGAFSGCTSLKEAVLPPNATTIGASAFAGNTGLTEIAMGHSVTSIGEKAFDRCPATVVNITAQTPPSASNNSFSNYSGRLNVQGEKTVDAYYDAFICWDRFEGFAMTEPTGLILNRTSVAGNQGDTIRLTATLRPDDVTLPHIFWRSTNPAIATVDNNGLVTIHAEADDAEVTAEADASSGNGCKIIAETLYAGSPVAEAEVFVTTSAIESITDDNSSAAGKIDYNAPLEVYNLLGVKVASSVDGLAKGIYIVRQGNATAKIAVK